MKIKIESQKIIKAVKKLEKLEFIFEDNISVDTKVAVIKELQGFSTKSEKSVQEGERHDNCRRHPKG